MDALAVASCEVRGRKQRRQKLDIPCFCFCPTGEWATVMSKGQELRELSLSLCDDESCKPNDRFEEEKCLHHEGSTGSTDKVTTPSLTEDDERPEKAEEERSEKEERGESLSATDVSCNNSHHGEERQEFSFTLYDFNGHGKVTKDVRLSLLGIEVRLAIGPDEDSCAAQTRPLSESSARSSAPTACTLLTDEPPPSRRAPESLSVPVHRKFPPQVENVAATGNRCKHSSGGMPASPQGNHSRRVKPRVHQRHELLQWLKESTEKACYQSAAAEDNRRPQQAAAARRAEATSRPEPTPCPYQLLDRGHECGGASSSPQCERRQHRRSKSHEEEPPCRGWHHHYRHRERDLERQRAMRQVASWIEREQLTGPPPPSAQRHEHHHLHEHVHHHYHHYVD
ncbi:hypothetical protein HPB51_025348 [Rhipicephalus microplus]|uniref:Protein naked cuticle homolog n=1 Tax=Rhipicephalus microplus TaxID=6941 RepID=A0A9J6DDW2_RHIMP|nr:hypothetical protein HPB51_025348 [Rhipicephalus microplus]